MASRQALIEELAGHFRYKDGTQVSKKELVRHFWKVTKGSKDASQLFHKRNELLSDAAQIQSKADFWAFIEDAEMYFDEVSEIMERLEGYGDTVEDFEMLSYFVALVLLDEVEDIANTSFQEVHNGERLTLGEVFLYARAERVLQSLDISKYTTN